MNKLVKLKEQKIAKVAEVDEILKGIEANGEVRALNAEERAKIAGLTAEIEDLNSTIELMEEKRAKTPEQKAEVKEKRDAEQRSREVFAKWLKREELDAEERTLMSNNTSGAFLPLTINKEIIEKLAEIAPLFNLARRFNTKGTLRIINETGWGTKGVAKKGAELTAEGVSFPKEDPAFRTIELTAYKIATEIDVTFEMLRNSEIDITSYVMDLLIRRLGAEINALLMMGSGSNQPQGLAKAQNVIKVQAGKIGVTIQDFIKVQTAMHPDYVGGCKWFMNRGTFQAAAMMLDNTGRPYMVSEWDTVNNKPVYKLLGHEIIISDVMDGIEREKTAVVFANPTMAYAINVIADINIRQLQEVKYTDGIEVFAGYLMADGKVYNGDAVAYLNMPSA